MGATIALVGCEGKANDTQSQNSIPAAAVVDSTVGQQTAVNTAEAVTVTEFIPVNLLKLENCPFPVHIVAGDSFSFPDELEEFGLSLNLIEGGGYELYRNNEFEGDNNVAQIDVSLADTATRIAFDGKGYNQPMAITVKNGVVTIERGGGKVAYNTKGVSKAYGSSKGIFKQLEIVVPRTASLYATVTNVLTVDAPLEYVQITAITKDAQVYLAKAKNVQSIDLAENSSVSIDSIGLIDKIELAGTGVFNTKSCDSASIVFAEGASLANFPTGTKFGTRTTAGTASIH